MNKLYITNVKYLGNLKLEIDFNDGVKKVVDFNTFISSSKNPEINKYKDENLFKKFSLEHGDLIWDDYDLVFPIWDLYNNQIDKGDKNFKEQDKVS
jgi:hypothetical protein